MKKEKTVKSYKRRTKSGKVVTVRQHTAKYDAAEKAKEAAKRKGAGDELEERKKKKASKLELPLDKETEKDILDEVKEAIKKEKPSKESKVKATKEAKSSTKTKAESKSKKAETSEPAFTAAEFKEWYQGTGSAADKKVAKALRAQLGRSGYKKLEDEAIDNYSSRGHLKMFKSLGEMKGEPKTSKKESVYEKYGTTHKEVVAYMKASPRKWKWDASDKVFYTSRMPDGGTAKSPYKVSLESAIKRMQKAEASSEFEQAKAYRDAEKRARTKALRDSEGKIEKGKNYFIGSNNEVHFKGVRMPNAKKAIPEFSWIAKHPYRKEIHKAGLSLGTNNRTSDTSLGLLVSRGVPADEAKKIVRRLNSSTKAYNKRNPRKYKR